MIRPFRVGLLCVALEAAVMWFGVTAHHDGDWTALFCTGALRPQPPAFSAEHIYLFPNATGYDGQFYHYLAHDPLPQGDIPRFMDNARLRYRRILAPLAAHLLALGQTQWVHTAFFAMLLAAAGAGGYWLAQWFILQGQSAWFGLSFAALPPILIAANRATIDAWLAAFCVAYLIYASKSAWRCYLVLLCAALIRETGVLLTAGHVLYCLTTRQWRSAVVYGSAVLPALFWWQYVARHVPHTAELSDWTYGLPLSGIAKQFVFWTMGSPAPFLLRVFDALCLVFTIAVMTDICVRLLRRRFDIFTCHLAAWLALSLVLASLSTALAYGYWSSSFSYARSLAPMFLLWSLQQWTAGRRLAASCPLLLSLRVGVDIVLNAGPKNL